MYYALLLLFKVCYSCFTHADITAGGCVNEVALWQIDDNIVISKLGKEYQSLDNASNTDIHNFKDFTTFLHNHDENVATAFKWCLEAIKMLHKHLSMICHKEDQHGSYSHSHTYQLYPTKNRYYFCHSVHFYPLR